MKDKREILEDINNKMKFFLRLKAKEFLEDKDSKEQIKSLSSMGFKPMEISEILGKTKNNVNTQLSQLREKGEIDD